MKKRKERGNNLSGLSITPHSPAQAPQEQTEEIPKEDSILWMGAAAQKSQKTRAGEEEQNESTVLSASRTKHVLFLAMALLEPSAS